MDGLVWKRHDARQPMGGLDPEAEGQSQDEDYGRPDTVGV